MIQSVIHITHNADYYGNPTHFFTEQDLLLQKEIIGWNGDTGACIEHSGKVEETD